jgi:hypothetical protein
VKILLNQLNSQLEKRNNDAKYPITNKQVLNIVIEPHDEETCGNCPMLLAWRFGTQFGCRIFSNEIGGMDTKGLKVDQQGVHRHEKCKRLSKKEE